MGATGGQSLASNAASAGGETVNNHFYRFLSVMCLVALGTATIFLGAQQPPQPAQPVSQSIAASSTNVQGIRGVNRVPYSADQVTVTTQTLADGTKITQRRFAKVYEDSQGRKRYEFYRSGPGSASQDESPESIDIFDPVAGVSYFLNPREHTAQREEERKRTAPPPAQATGTSSNLATARPPLPQPTREDLGTQVIEGIEARGRRITRTIPEGAQGNDQPLQVTEETWSSENPPLLLLRIRNDPRRGETVMRLTNLVFEEPPAELFQVPADYTVQELQPVTRPETPSE